MRKRNFKTLVVGRYYVNSMERPYPVHIVSNNNGYYKDHLGGTYTKEGYCYDHNGRELTTEVTVTVTPVVPPKPRELWLVYSEEGHDTTHETLECAEAYIRGAANSTGLRIEHMREVLRGDEP